MLNYFLQAFHHNIKVKVNETDRIINNNTIQYVKSRKSCFFVSISKRLKFVLRMPYMHGHALPSQVIIIIYIVNCCNRSLSSFKQTSPEGGGGY